MGLPVPRSRPHWARRSQDGAGGAAGDQVRLGSSAGHRGPKLDSEDLVPVSLAMAASESSPGGPELPSRTWRASGAALSRRAGAQNGSRSAALRRGAASAAEPRILGPARGPGGGCTVDGTALRLWGPGDGFGVADSERTGRSQLGGPSCGQWRRSAVRERPSRMSAVRGSTPGRQPGSEQDGPADTRRLRRPALCVRRTSPCGRAVTVPSRPRRCVAAH